MKASDTIGKHHRSPVSGLEHSALFYADDDSFLRGVLEHARFGLELSDVVLVALPSEHLATVRGELGTDGGDVHFQDLTRLARNPARLVPALRSFVDLHTGEGRRVRAVGESWWPGRSADERAACLQHDALANLALDGASLSMLCPYDARGLDEDAKADVCAAHSHHVEDGVAGANPNYGDPLKLSESIAGPLPEPDVFGETLVFGAPHGPRSVRLAVGEHARRAGLPDSRVADFCLAVHEVAVNTVVHTDGPGILSLWEEDGSVIAEIQDSGYIADPLAGRHPPGPTDGRGYGLYLTHRLCDLVRVHTTVDGGTTVRMSMRISS